MPRFVPTRQSSSAHANAFDLHLDRQRHARRRRHVVGRRLRLEREALRAESAHHDAAGKERSGFHVSATSSALACVSRPRHSRRRMRTVSNSEPVAPSISSAPPLRATSSRTTKSMPAWLARKRTAAPMIAGEETPRRRRARAAVSRRRVRGGALSRVWRVASSHVAPSERESDGKLHAHLAHVLSVGDVEAERTERRAHARADAVAQREVRVATASRRHCPRR